MQTVWWLMTGASVIIYIVFAGFVFPKLIFKAEYDVPFSYDRGLRNFKESQGRSIVYQPQSEYKKYINKYILSDRDGKKVIVCNFQEDVVCIDYDVVLFNCRNRVLKIINIKENTAETNRISTTELPEKTAYATVIVNSVNNIKIDKPIDKKIGGGWTSFALVSGALSFLEVFFIKLCFANLFGDVFNWAFMTNAGSILITFAAGLIASAVSIGLAAVIFKLKAAKRERGRV